MARTSLFTSSVQLCAWISFCCEIKQTLRHIICRNTYQSTIMHSSWACCASRVVDNQLLVHNLARADSSAGAQLLGIPMYFVNCWALWSRDLWRSMTRCVSSGNTYYDVIFGKLAYASLPVAMYCIITLWLHYDDVSMIMEPRKHQNHVGCCKDKPFACFSLIQYLLLLVQLRVWIICS